MSPVMAQFTHRLPDLLLMNPSLGEIPPQTEPPGDTPSGPDDAGRLRQREPVVVPGDPLPAPSQQFHQQLPAEASSGIDPTLVLLVKRATKLR